MSRTRGYTMTEMMVTVAILGVLISVAAPLLVQMTNFWRQTTARNTIQRDVRASLDIINRFCRQARAGTVVIDQAAGQPPFSRITFASVQGQTISFYQSGNRLYMTQGNRVSVLSKSIAFIAFTYPRSDDTSIVSVAITAQAATYLGGSKALQLSIQKVRVMN
ncbi:MAG: prepilin-type N-terminal cleavage/methylation domain-containing protein [Elusimicrobia bacterium]|nr:prepilin-type N-terminal cleavage/methylation domain-containing protein [Elusimicrobiota bacterium]